MTDPDILASEIFGILQSAIARQPRSLQTRIGPSEIGVPCDRRIGHKLAGTQPSNRVDDVAWKAFIGTAVHSMLADIMALAEISRFHEADSDTKPRWHVEEKVSPGFAIDGIDIDGSCDLFDEENGAVWDWKITTRNKIRETYKPDGVGDQYRIQAQAYGRGWARQGFDVKTVGVIFLTRDGEFSDRHVWSEPYDEQIVTTAIGRVEGIKAAIDGLGPEIALPLLATGPAYCRFCPYFSTRPATSRTCGGHQMEDKQTLSQIIGAMK